MIYYIILFFLALIIVVLSIACFNLLRTVEQYEDEFIRVDTENQMYIQKINEIRENVLRTEIQLKEVDIRGSFEADDEVGFAFKNIKDIYQDLTKIVIEIYESINE